jgi:hypothetical protein
VTGSTALTPGAINAADTKGHNKSRAIIDTLFFTGFMAGLALDALALIT